MREIRSAKFRGKRKDNGEWVYGDLQHHWECRISDYCDSNPVDPSTVGQYTGLKDKNGKDIYEGDILTREGCWPHMVCKWDGGAFKIDWFWMHREDMGMYEVIGNIHDNPELVKGGESK